MAKTDIQKKLRFAVVGIANTLIDLTVFAVLVAVGLGSIAANYGSTTVALIFSFFANRSITYRHSGRPTGRQLSLFLIITLLGLWVLQPLVIYATEDYLARFSGAYAPLLAKLCATTISLVWNYVMYGRFVFQKVAS